MKQTNLLSFLGKKEEDYLIPNNFIMEWTTSQPGKTMFLYDIEFDKKDYMFLGSFTWRDFSQENSIYFKNNESQPKLFKPRSKKIILLLIYLY